MTPEYIEESFFGDVWIYAVVGGIKVGRIHVAPRELPYGRVSQDYYAEILALQVEKEFRRRGIGRELIRRGLAWAKGRGYNHVAVETSARKGSAGLPTYQALGFVPRSVILDIELTNEDHRRRPG